MGRAKAKQNLAAGAPWRAEGGEPAACALCGRAGVPLTKHHLVPRATHGRARIKREHAGVDLKHATAPLCRPCHRTVHATLSERELAERYHTVEALRSHPALARFARFAAKQDPHRRVAVRKPR
ncbi:hypothetical protein [Phycisphaera mikurensis]|uniref:HNH domain-containing protein n=1 Tax=Phycisphaera mikurensis (strain NBRC 102666 / KCTC 22515 / FYK2301M01) TaxID=1142394 RepID=I0ICH7_PHYMF|nr:hypothetical protein [Phycisphaera mikurensis]MBB6442159.1 hypothetical protein [Phycisphaera mikurensis]BAM02965.1 hypothetical protein PSMK_08060 [Phycisphaera mikurensis NBRC 102666]